MTQFAVVLSALIHDLGESITAVASGILTAFGFLAIYIFEDHPGVPNATLVKEGTSLAKLYKDKSVAEQNSVDLAWEVLMSEDYKELRNTICATKSERKRFRQVRLLHGAIFKCLTILVSFCGMFPSF